MAGVSGSSPYRGRTTGPAPSRQASINRCIVSTRTSGWSPSRRRSASRVGCASALSNPARIEWAIPASGLGLTTGTSPARSTWSRAARSSAATTTHPCPSTPAPIASTTAAHTCQRIGSPCSSAASLPPPNRRPGPAASTTAPTLMIPRGSNLDRHGDGKVKSLSPQNVPALGCSSIGRAPGC